MALWGHEKRGWEQALEGCMLLLLLSDSNQAAGDADGSGRGWVTWRELRTLQNLHLPSA